MCRELDFPTFPGHFGKSNSRNTHGDKRLQSILLVVILLLALAACNRPRDWNEPTRIVGKTAALIADFTPPANYKPEFGLHALGYTAVAYQNDSNGQLYLVQSEETGDGEALKKALGEMVPGYHDQEGDLTVVEQRVAAIRGQNVTLTISEGAGWENEKMRQATAVFQGKAGPALLILREPVSQWDREAVESFLASLR